MSRMAQEFERKMKMIQSDHSAESVSDGQKEQSAMAKTNAERNREYRERKKAAKADGTQSVKAAKAEKQAKPKKVRKAKADGVEYTFLNIRVEKTVKDALDKRRKQEGLSYNELAGPALREAAGL